MWQLMVSNNILQVLYLLTAVGRLIAAVDAPD
jgi:hypothetical protein